MADEPEGRRFSPEETALILRRATDGEQRLENRRDDTLSLDEIVAAAHEAGIDAAAVRRAAAVSLVPTDSFRSRLWGAPIDPIVQGVFTGSLSPERHAAVRAAIERTMRHRGEVETVGSTFIWREEHGLGRTSVEVTTAGSTVEVTGQAERKGHQLALISSVALAVGIGLLPLGGFAGLAAVMGPTLAVLAPIGAIFVGTRLTWPILQKRSMRALEASVLEVGAIVEEGSAPRLEAGKSEES